MGKTLIFSMFLFIRAFLNEIWLDKLIKYFTSAICFPEQHPNSLYFVVHFYISIAFIPVYYTLHITSFMFFSHSWNISRYHFLVGSLMYPKCPKKFLSLKKYLAHICWTNYDFSHIVKMFVSLGFSIFQLCCKFYQWIF